VGPRQSPREEIVGEIEATAQLLYDPSGGAATRVQLARLDGPDGLPRYRAAIRIDPRLAPIERFGTTEEAALAALLSAVHDVARLARRRG
jgi:hypothetical protein